MTVNAISGEEKALHREAYFLVGLFFSVISGAGFLVFSATEITETASLSLLHT